MQALGYGAKNTYNRYCFEESSPVSNLFLNLKYMIERQGKDKASTWFTEIHRYGNVAILHNNAYLPLGFLTEEKLAQIHFDINGNGFRFQNELMKAAAGIQGDVWMLMTGNDFEIRGEDVTIADQNASGYCSYREALKGGTVIYSYTADSDGFMCVEVNFPKRNNLSVWKNGVELYTETISLPQMLAVGDVVVGDVVEIRASCKTANESGTLTVNAAILSEERFRECYEILAASTLELTEFTNTRVSGTISCNRDGLLYTSIPQNGNWHAVVDGEEVEIVTVGEAMCAVYLTEGEHEVTFTYHNAAFSLGWKISLVSLAVFLTLIYISKAPSRSKGKYFKR